MGSGTRFDGNFCINVACFFCLFLWSSLLNHAHSWFERSFPHTQVRWQSFPWPLKVMTSQAIEGAWIRTGGLVANGLMGHLFLFVFLFFFFFCQGDKASAILSKRYYYLAIKSAKYCNITVTETSTLSKQNPIQKVWSKKYSTITNDF